MKNLGICGALAVGALLALVSFSSEISAQSMPPVRFTWLTVTKADPATCSYRWSVKVHNDGDVDITSAMNLGLVGYQSKVQHSTTGYGAGGTSVLGIPAHSYKEIGLNFGRRAGTLFYLTLRADYGGVKAFEQVHDIPEEIPPVIKLGKYDFDGTTIHAQILNTAVEGSADISVQGYSASAGMGDWKAMGAAESYRCLPSNTSGVVWTARKAFSLPERPQTHVKIEVSKLGKVLFTQIVGLAAPTK